MNMKRIKHVTLFSMFCLTAVWGCDGNGTGDCDPPCGEGQTCVGGVCVAADADVDVEADVPPDTMDPAQEDPAGDPVPDTDPDAGDTVEVLPDTVEDDPGVDTVEEEVPPLPDSDGDTIADRDEGDGAVDTDGDTVPDTLDSDSDDDTIPDSIEAGDDNPYTVPVDSDGDTVRDFRDDDSDGDGIPDSEEGASDEDGDDIPNYRDLDSDGDFINDSIEGTVDSDGDTTPDYLDLDSDADTILDFHESLLDDDEDGIFNYLDDDSDGDTILDADEAGDDELSTEPINCDDDEWENYRDHDSDNDGIPDEDETYGGCPDVCLADSDGDGASDLVEIVYGSDACNTSDNPMARGDFVFEVPYEESPIPTMDTLSFSTSLRQADVYFMVDTTGSMGGEIENLQDSLSLTIIPGVRGLIDDVWFGVGGFDDYPVNPFGWTGDRVFYQEQRMTSSTTAAQSAVGRLTVHDGNDRPESHVPALWAIATGSGLGPSYLLAQTLCGVDEYGYPCFRDDSIPIVVLISDAPFHNDAGGNDPYSGISPTPPSYSTALTQLTNASIKVLGVNSGDSLSRDDLQRLARDTGATDKYGSDMVFNIPADGDGLGDQVVNAIRALATNVPMAVSTRAVDDDSDLVDATIFIDHIVPNTLGDPFEGCEGGLAAEDTDIDGWDDTFTSVLPGTMVCFDIYVKMNETVEPIEEPQIYLCDIEVLGDGVTVLDTRVVYFLIPPVIEQN